MWHAQSPSLVIEAPLAARASGCAKLAAGRSGFRVGALRNRSRLYLSCLRISSFSRHAWMSTANPATLCEKPIKIGGNAISALLLPLSRLQPIDARQRQHPLRIAARQISTTSSLSRLARRPSLTNFSMTQKQIAPTMQMIRTEIKTESMAAPVLVP